MIRSRSLRWARWLLVSLLAIIFISQCFLFWSTELTNEETTPTQIESCSTLNYPEDVDLNYNNVLWQEYRSNKLNVFLLRAFLDERSPTKNEVSIRIISMIDRLEPNGSLICLIWFSDEPRAPIDVRAEFVYVWFHRWGNYKDSILQPFVVDCRVSREVVERRRRSKMFVSLVDGERCSWKVTNRVEVITRTGRPTDDTTNNKKKDFVVCVKPLEFAENDMTHRLIEWIELLRLVGVELIQFYVYSINSNMTRVLDHYRRQGLVRVREHTLPAWLPNDASMRRSFLRKKIIHKRQNELIPYNDCFYEHFNDFRFVVLLDIDEMIVPIKDRTWKEMIDRVETSLSIRKRIYSSYSVRNVYFFDGIKSNLTLTNQTDLIDSRYLHMLTHVYRSSNYTRNGAYIKTFFKTESLVAVHNHFARHCLHRCRRFDINTADGHLQHYRSDCVRELKKFCDDQFKSNVELDLTVRKYREPLIRSVFKTLFELQLIERRS